MELEEYRTWRDVAPDRSNLLLDWDTEQPTSRTLESDDGALARIASVIHENASTLEPRDCELIVHWMKSWKRARLSRPPPRHPAAFDQVLDEIRNSHAQKDLMAKAASHGMAVDRRTVVAFIIAGGAVVSALAPGIRWYWSVLALAVAFVIYVNGQLRGVVAAKAWKEQDRRYFMQSIRAARTIQELSHAGLFGYLPGSEFGPGYDEDKAGAVLRKERERLSDALYNDPDYWLRE